MTVTGVHGVKRRWLDATVRDGLVRPSAAWFLTSPGSPPAEAVSTLTAATYLALSPATRAALAARREPGGLVRLFGERPELLPAWLLFRDEPTGRETLHRYTWLGGTGGLTAPYTKVERAGRTVDGGRFDVLELDLADVAGIESDLDRSARPAGWWEDRPLLRRVDATGPHAPTDPGVATRIGAFCAAVAARLRGRGPLPAPTDPTGGGE